MSALLEPAAPSAASRHARLDALVERARERARSTMPVVGLVHPGDALALQAAAQMQDAGIARPLLIGSREAIARAAGAAGAAAARVTRLPAGHPEGYLEAFATLYGEIAQAIRARRPRGAKADRAAQFPGLADGVAGVEFIAAAVASARRGGRWVRLPEAGRAPPLKP